ncbi:glycosyl hydrolase-related protein [Arthrobacter sp. zg-Y916]|uniref:alpha-mannosidase n=1 Tax=Arthrobacter sp. zg-Y916 TaxID=2894190 RepID=UPI001E2D2AAF|nr:glycoside hydrolase family 38 C-terminal domain-containing protein [Arthrobacter sp. zg-Y916]MCC9194523.1 glycosyl hydrolase-related protein [Arthrobacter sp. zg-Y916]
MHQDRELTERRIARFLAQRLTPSIWTAPVPLHAQAWDCPGEPVSFAEAAAQDYRPFPPGSPWGRPWQTTWLRLTGSVPAAPDGFTAEAVIDLGFSTDMPGFQAEGLVYSADGTVLKALESTNMAVPLTGPAGSDVTLFVEAAATPNVIGSFSFLPTPLGDRETAGTEPLYLFRRADTALLDRQVWNLAQDFAVLWGLMHELPMDSPRRHNLLRALAEAVNAVVPDDVHNSAAAARRILEPALSAPAAASAHRVHAVGHAHIDSAWLWPVRETRRKVARTFANVLALMETDPDFVFTASSAQQYAWLLEDHPQLFARVAERVAEGRFVPAGGMWVEADTNLPSGESLVRQFTFGKRFFMENFGVEPLDVWLPDSFGYSGALPQIVRSAGSRWFLTQKLSWNESDVMPHHTFLWEGIDGTRVFTHFPPVDTYNSALTGQELARAERQFREKGATNLSLVPYGWGDGGGGPTREMLAAAHRTASLEGSPRVQLSSPRTFFEEAEADYADPPVWSGEMYLQFHRGTYTSQARTKRGNRRSESVLREAELWAATAAVRTAAPYPYEELEEAWKTVLLGQFHDILPGSSIAWVYQDIEQAYERTAAALETIIGQAQRELAGSGGSTLVFNAAPIPLQGVAPLAAESAALPPVPGRLTELDGGGWELSSEHLSVRIDPSGAMTSLRAAQGRELLLPGHPGNVFQLFRDTPNQWDAWDIDAADRRSAAALLMPDSVEAGDGSLTATYVFGASRLQERVCLSPDGRSVDLVVTVDWHERQKLLKLAFPVGVLADRAASEIQFGHIQRPTHANTSWDHARFETPAHRWVHVGEDGEGISLANDSTYGYDITRTGNRDAGTGTLVRASLLRAPLFPDPGADQGGHVFRFSLRPEAAVADAVAEGYRLNLPPRTVSGCASTQVPPVVSLSPAGVLAEAVKLADDRSGDVVLRLYESLGRHTAAFLEPGFEVRDAALTDLLERPAGEAPARNGRGYVLDFRPFEVKTLRLSR